MKVILSPTAREYVKSEALYLKSKSSRAAQSFADDLKRLRQGLGRFSRMGRATEEMPVPGILRFVMGPYLVDYEIRPEAIIIFSIRHGRERPPGVDVNVDFDHEERDGGDGE
ncbi:type II toxin-antitoxin system RelE/ParE family toxin [Rhizobium sp. 18055]|uniref:type II toxin-antitoxin system RelE/ParE family toxin n=1 Tax=Rhizobium sp. 18055 TaxID=2681403 RepID=UPI00135B38B2|nr:type II toxin-antitoxin system RelE/ParE family toxin [Rhizobium sp. 18055]